MPTAPLSLTASPIETAAVVRLAEGDGAGWPVRGRGDFVGTVRRENQGRQVAHLDYEAYEPLAVKALGLIAGEVAGTGHPSGWRSSIGRDGSSPARPAS